MVGAGGGGERGCGGRRAPIYLARRPPLRALRLRSQIVTLKRGLRPRASRPPEGLLFLVLAAETDFTAAFRRGWWRHELPDSVEYHFELRVVALLQVVDFAGQVLVAPDELAQLDESAHHIDADFVGRRRVQDVSGHDGPVLREDKGQVFAMLAATWL